MATNRFEAGNSGSFNTGRLLTIAVLLLVGGIAAPRLKDLCGLSYDEGGGSVTSRLTRVQDTARAMTTLQRMRGVRTALMLWSTQHGAPDANDLVGAVGKDTATDDWGRSLLYSPPTVDSPGCLRSLGPDGVRSKDDIFVTIAWKDVNGPKMAPGWQ